MKLLNELGVLALGARFSILADRLFEEVQAIYRAKDISFDPRNFLIFRELMQQGESSVSSLAHANHCTHARASQKLAELTKQKLVEPTASADGRKSCFRLSNKGRLLVAQLEPIWAALEDVLLQKLDSDSMLNEVIRFENQMAPGHLSSLVLALLSALDENKDSQAPANLTFKILEPTFAKEICSDFKRLNRRWLKEYGFGIEAPDQAVFSDLSAHVRKYQGLLFVVEKKQTTIGVALLLRRNAKEFELSKFCVDKSEQGKGIGKRLLALCETEARMRQATNLYLETSSKLKTATKLYESAGFQSKPAKDSNYSRVDLIMTKKL